MLTRFVASTGTSRQPIVAAPATIEDVRCVVRMHTSRGERELVIATELGGGIRVFADRTGLPQRARTQLAFHEVASGRVLEIEADELHIFDLQTIELLPNAPGSNDALYLHGAMRGPYPAVVGTPVVAVDGQLTVTRSDLLSGLVDGVANAFAYAPDPHGSRCVHALLPGERADVLATGRGIVLALPLVPGWLLDCPVPNDLIAAQILHDVLSALRADLGMGVETLPVPSRAALETKLIAAGWRIEGDEAIRPKGRGVIGSMLQGSERRRLPREGTLDELVAEAKTVLARMPSILTAEAAALGRRTARMRTSRVPVSPRPAPAVPAAAPRPRVETSPTEWMKDFEDAAEPDTPDHDKPKRDWSDDFD